jgi:small-conductance mechanosensitive channel
VRFGDAVRRVALAFIREKQLPESVWYGDRIDFTFTSLFWGALLLSVSIVLSPLIWILLQPVLYFMSQDISNPVERWLWLLSLLIFLFILNVCDGFIQKASRDEKVSYSDLSFGEIVIYWMVSAITCRWMYLPAFSNTMSRFFTGFLAIWYLYFVAFLSGMY